MSKLITPSQKMHSLVNPLPSSQSVEGENRVLLMLKLIIGTPVPYFMILYSVALLTSMSGMELCSWTVASLTLFYIILDLPSKQREFRFFGLGTDLSLLGFLIVVVVGLYINAPQANFVTELGSLRWMLLLYLLSYSFALFPGLNKLFYIIIGLSAIVAAYAIFQHFTGIDLRYEWGLRAQSAVTPAPFTGSNVYQSVGLMSHHLTYGYLFSMIFCFPLAALMLNRRRSSLLRIFLLLTVTVIGLSLLWTYGRGVWIATLCAILFMAAYVSRKALFGILVIGAIAFGILYSSNTGFRERLDSIWATHYTSNTDRQDLWRANWEMLADHPWIGIGWNQNEGRVQEYYTRLGITNSFSGHAHNNYMQILATTGVLGFLFYNLFIIGFLLMTHRLWSDVPKSHYWHKVFVLGALGSQISLQAGGLTQWNFGDAEVNHFFIFVLATIAYMAERYSDGVVPDDYSL
jgi:O-antigen ligase